MKLHEAIAQQVEVTIRPEEQNQLESAESINPAAYEAYLKGQFHVERFTPQDIKLAAQYFQQAVELDPDHALPYAGLAKLCAFQAQTGMIRPQVARERCLPPIVKALELDDSLPDAHLAYAAHMTWLLIQLGGRRSRVPTGNRSEPQLCRSTTCFIRTS